MGMFDDLPNEVAPPNAAKAGAAGMFDDLPSEGNVARDVPMSALRGINKGVTELATLPFRALDAASKEASERSRAAGDQPLPFLPQGSLRDYLPRALFEGGYLSPPAPETGMGRFAQSAGEAVGSTVIPTGGLLAKAEKLKKLAPETTLRSLWQQAGEFFAERPGAAVAADVAGATASGIGSQTAREADLGPGFEIAAGAAAPVAAVGAPVAAMRGARALLRIPPDAFTPTMERWKANGNAIFRRLGIEASADGAIPASETAGGQAAAYMTLANTLRRANVPIEQLDDVLSRFAEARRFYSNSYAPDAVALVDLDPSLQKLAGSLMRENPEVWRQAVDFMYARQTGLTPPRGEVPASRGIPSREMFSPPITGKQALEEYGTTFGTPKKSIVPMGQRERVGDAFRRALVIEDADFHGHAPTASMTDTQLEAFAGEASKPAYEAARTAAKGVDLRPTLNPILDRWEQAATAEPGPVGVAIRRQIKEVRRAIENGNDKVSAFERFDKVKQLMDEVIRKMHNAIDSRASAISANALTTFKNELLKGSTEQGTKIFPGVDDIAENGLGALYSEARGIFSGVANARRALETGRKIWKGEAGLDEFNALEGDKASQKLVRLGIHGGYEADTANTPSGHDVAKLFDKPRLRDVLGEIIPRSGGDVFHDTPERFGRYLGTEQVMSGTPKKTFQGSPTAERGADDKAAKELFDLTDQLKKGGVQQVISSYAADVLNKMFGYRADTAATMGRALFTANPVERAAAINEIRKHMGQDRFSYFQKLMSDQAQRTAQAGVAATPGATASDQSQSPVSGQRYRNKDGVEIEWDTKSNNWVKVN